MRRDQVTTLESYNKVTTSIFFHFQSPNRRSKPLDIQSILKCAWRQNFTFFGIFLLFIKMGTKSLFLLKFCTIKKQRFCTHLNK